MPKITGAGRFQGSWPPRSKGDETSILKDETRGMERKRRLQEQQGLRTLIQARVESKNEDEFELHQELSGEEYQDEMLSHPLLDGQPLDGVEINAITSPRAREKFLQAQKRQQEHRDLVLSLQPQNRLTNTPTFTPRFNPKPGGP